MMELDLSPYSTQSRMWIEHHTKRQDAICAEIIALRSELQALRDELSQQWQTLDSSRLFRVFRWIGLFN